MDAPENTLAAVRAANEHGVKWIEVDVKITYDGIPILMHDETLDRTTSGTGLVAETTWEKIQKLDAGKSFDSRFVGERIPLLTEVVQAVLSYDMSMIVEIKPCAGRARATTMVTVIEMAKVWPEQKLLPVIASYDDECLEIAAQLEPHWPRCILMDQWDPEWHSRVDRQGASAVALREDQLTASRVKMFVDYNIPLLAYTLSDAARAKELLAWGVAAVYAGSPRDIVKP